MTIVKQESYRETENKCKKMMMTVSDAIIFCFFEAFLDSSTCTEDIYLYLFFADVENGSDVSIALAFDISELHDGALFFRQLVDELANQLHTVPLHGLFLWIRGHPAVGRFDIGIERLYLVVHTSEFIE